MPGGDGMTPVITRDEIRDMTMGLFGAGEYLLLVGSVDRDRNLRACGEAMTRLRSGAAVREDAELVPLWVGKYDPAHIALADVGVSST